jgi:hypothetical protein
VNGDINTGGHREYKAYKLRRSCRFEVIGGDRTGSAETRALGRA